MGDGYRNHGRSSDFFVLPILAVNKPYVESFFLLEEQGGDIQVLVYSNVHDYSSPFPLIASLTFPLIKEEYRNESLLDSDIVDVTVQNSSRGDCETVAFLITECITVSSGGTTLGPSCETTTVSGIYCSGGGSGSTTNTDTQYNNNTGGGGGGGTGSNSDNTGGNSSTTTTTFFGTVSGLCFDPADLTQIGDGWYVNFSNFGHNFLHNSTGISVQANFDQLCIQVPDQSVEYSFFGIDNATMIAIATTEAQLDVLYPHTIPSDFEVKQLFKLSLEASLSSMFGGGYSLNTSPNGCPGVPSTPTVWGC